MLASSKYGKSQLLRHGEFASQEFFASRLPVQEVFGKFTSYLSAIKLNIIAYDASLFYYRGCT